MKSTTTTLSGKASKQLTKNKHMTTFQEAQSYIIANEGYYSNTPGDKEKINIVWYIPK